jgi:hypothetical protein
MADLTLGKDKKFLFCLVGILAILYAANWQSVKWGYSPFLYCWMPNFGEFFMGWMNLVHLVAVVWICWAVWTKNYGSLAKAVIVLALVVGAPGAFDTIFRLGGTCR